MPGLQGSSQNGRRELKLYKGCHFPDGTCLSWQTSEPPSEACLSTPTDYYNIPIDSAHLDAVLDGVPTSTTVPVQRFSEVHRVLHFPTTTRTVRDLLQVVYDFYQTPSHFLVGSVVQLRRVVLVDPRHHVPGAAE